MPRRLYWQLVLHRHLPIPGIDSENIVTSDELLSMTSVPILLLLLEAGLSGLSLQRYMLL